jgi:hypothetical protein
MLWAERDYGNSVLRILLGYSRLLGQTIIVSTARMSYTDLAKILADGEFEASIRRHSPSC